MISTAPPPARATIASRVVDCLIVDCLVVVVVVDTAITGITPRARRYAPHRTAARTLTTFAPTPCDDDDDKDAIDARFSNRAIDPAAGVAIAAIVVSGIVVVRVRACRDRARESGSRRVRARAARRASITRACARSSDAGGGARSVVDASIDRSIDGGVGGPSVGPSVGRTLGRVRASRDAPS